MAKKKARVRLVDTTFRDAQQSLLGGYLRTEEILPIAAKMDSIGFAAMEAFGGATFETQLSIHEDPWEYLRKLNKVTPSRRAANQAALRAPASPIAIVATGMPAGIWTIE